MLVRVHTLRSIQPDAWTRAHAQGLVPDALPYGLDRLGDYGFDVRHAPRVDRASYELRGRAMRAAGFRWDWQAAAAALRSGCDVALCWDERTGIPMVLGQRGRRLPVAMGVIWLTDQNARGLKRRLADRGLQGAQLVWALSSAQIPVLRKDFGLRDSQLFRLPFGVDVEFWQVPAGSPRTARQTSVVLTVGNDRDRDFTLVLKSLSPLCRASGVELRVVSEVAVSVPADVGVRLPRLSHVDLKAEYAKADVVCVGLRPNLHVSGMTTVLEAQAMGLPVVCTRTPGMGDYVLDGVTGILVEPGNVEDMRTAVQSLLDDPERAKAMGRAGRQFVERSASSASQARHMAEMLATMAI